MILQKSQPIETGHACLSSVPTEDTDVSLPARKAHTHEIPKKKLAAFRTLANCHGPHGMI